MSNSTSVPFTIPRAISDSPSQTLLNSLNDAAGLVSFASLLTLGLLDAWKLSFSYRSLVQLMIYTDCIAFVLQYCAFSLADPTGVNSCNYNILMMMSDLVWVFKDAFKISYIVWRTLFVTNVTKGRSGLWTHVGVQLSGLFSVILYMLFNYSAYNGFNICGSANAVPASYRDWTRPLLYGYWVILDLVCTIALLTTIYKFSAFERDNSYNNGKSPLSKVIFRELTRVVITAGAGVAICGCTIVESIRGGGQILPLKALLFTLSQHVLLLSVMRYAPGSDDASSAHSPQY
ncbi:uncharacterized protein BJ171DRAFT_586326 [Polychytrium aggregatum]|uniref:uncharacterized protein n=1 Tax=Polychytrium aggregatum TaxID=110093 RepID=UPI0022FEC4C2|nr:uncharacterized protein BJ171DRAFT_586326 [Polychytrium aggregatum]KAI9197073.1 hypothetical protein BJ171DRAFT_586326 [Polychytrium aggregatum]